VRIASLFPHLEPLHIDALHPVGEIVHLELRYRSRAASCPSCHRRSRRIHSGYTRRIADLPVAGRPVVLHLGVRRFRCGNRRCACQTFTEQIPSLVAPYARRTEPLRIALEHVGLALGGRPGQRLTGHLGLATSRGSLLHLVRALPEPVMPDPRVLGVDEFAVRRGRVYGTVLVDGETHRPVDLLDGRSADQFADWLRARSAPEVICRDRGGCYADGATRGAPEAIQVADRWHLLDNLGDAIERVARHHARCWQHDPDHPPPGESTPGPSLRAARTAARTLEPAAEPATPITARHHERFTQIHQLLGRGMSLTAIAATLHLDRHTVRKFARASSPEAIGAGRRRGVSPLLAPYREYLHRRWQEGGTNGKRLLEEIRARGYRGSHRTLGRYLTRLRRGAPPPPATRSVTSVTARAIAGLSLRRPETLKHAEHALLERLGERCPELATTIRLARTFARLVRERPGLAEFEAWLTETADTGIAALVSFAAGLRRDAAAVAAGLTLPWSSGLVEGHNTRIKVIKRTMYGRANFDLLRRRVLLAS
jgi:transposase